MRRRTFIVLVVTVLGCLLLPMTPALAVSNPPDDGVVIWNRDYTLAEGETVHGDLVVFNGDATLEPDSHVEGDVVVWNGSADVDGTIEGTLVTSNGDIRLGSGAYVQGDVVCTWNCDIEQEEGARLGGDLIEGPSLRGIPFEDWDVFTLPLIEVPTGPLPFWVSGPEEVLERLFKLISKLVTILVIAIVGGLVGLIWPGATAQVGQAAFETPGPSVGVGVLTTVAALTLIVFLAVTICLSPAAMLLMLALATAGLFGWIAIGARVGERLLESLEAGEVPSMWTAGLGTLLITLISVGLSNAFCLAPLGWLLTFVVGCFGLGAVVLTRFGTMPYVPGQRRQAPPPPSAPAQIQTPESLEPAAPDIESGEEESA